MLCENKYHTVYLITSKDTPRFYVGKHSTNNLNDSYMGSGKWVKSIRDKNSLHKEILGVFDSEDEAYKFEEEMVEALKFDSPDLCMNFVNGGRRGRLNVPYSEESKRKMSERKKGKPLKPEHREAISRSLIGRIATKEHREKLSKSRSGKLHSLETKEKIRQAKISQYETTDLSEKVNASRKRWIVCLKTGMVFLGLKEAAEFWGVNKSTVYKICNGIKKIKRFDFEYMDQ